MSDEVNRSAEIEGGFVLMARSIANSSLMTTPSNAFKVAIWLLARVRYEDYKWFDRIQNKDIVIKRGEVTCNYKDITEKTNLSLQQVRSAIEHLAGRGKGEGHGFIEDITPNEVKVAHGYMHFRIVKYEHYQCMNNYFTPVLPITHEQHRANTGLTQEQHSDNTYLSNDKEQISKDKKENTPLDADDQLSLHLAKIHNQYCPAQGRELSRKHFKSALTTGLKITEQDIIARKGMMCWDVVKDLQNGTSNSGQGKIRGAENKSKKPGDYSRGVEYYNR